MTGSRRGCAAILLAAALPFAAPLPASGQEGFRNTDRGRPLLVEDAYPIELREWEFELGAHGRVVEGGIRNGAGVRTGLKTGILLNTQIGIELETVAERSGSGTELGFGGVGAHVLYGINRETWSWPAFAVRAEARAPGSETIRRGGWSLELAGIATRSLGRLRLHANGGRHFSHQESAPDSWQAGLGADYPIGLFSRLVMADVFMEIPVDAGRTRVWLEMGTRWQLSNSSVLDVGLATRLDEWDAGRANMELTAGLSLAFGIPGLTSVSPYPNPKLD